MAGFSDSPVGRTEDSIDLLWLWHFLKLPFQKLGAGVGGKEGTW